MGYLLGLETSIGNYRSVNPVTFLNQHSFTMFHGSEIQHVTDGYPNLGVIQSPDSSAKLHPCLQSRKDMQLQCKCLRGSHFAGFISAVPYGDLMGHSWRHDATCLTDLNLHSPIKGKGHVMPPLSHGLRYPIDLGGIRIR